MWYNDYVGIPFLAKGRDAAGVDCWGLVRLVYKEEFDIELPSFADDYEYDDTDRIEQLAAQYKEGWEETTIPKPGSVVLFKVLGHISHIGIYIGGNKFLHCLENHSSVIESLDSINWNKRFAGFYNYSEKSAAVLNAVPHPLRTERWTVPVAPGTTVEQLSHWVLKQFGVSKELDCNVTIIRNGVVVPKEAYSTTVILDHDTIEYRAVPGKSLLRIALMIAVIYVAAQTGGAFGASAASTLGITGANAAVTGAAIVTATVSTVGNLLIGYLMPIRPPVQKDPGTAAPQLLLSGGSNQASKYAAIPVVLGKVRMTPLLGGENYIDSNTDNSYLNMLLVWGFGPLEIDKASLRIGLNPLTQYENGAGIGVEHYHLNDSVTPDDANDKLNFNALYGSDRQQVYLGTTLRMSTSPVNLNVDEGDEKGAVGPWIEATLNQTNTARIDVNIHFPQGLRKLDISGSNAGDIKDLEVKFQVQVQSVNKNTLVASAWGSPTANATFPGKTIIVDRSYDTLNNPRYRWTRIGIGKVGLQVKVGPRCATQTSVNGIGEAKFVSAYSSYLTDAAIAAGATVADIGTRLPTWSADIIPLADVCMYGDTLVATVDYGATLRNTNIITGMTITSSDVTSFDYDTADWENPTAGANTGDKLITVAVGTISRSTDTVISLGTEASGLFRSRKDAFSYTVSTSVTAAEDTYYRVRVRRLTDDNEDEPDKKNKLMHTMVFQTATATGTNRPIKEGTNWRLAKSALRIKANDQLNSRIEGVNAIVQTICPDWTPATSEWTARPTNNPASLFLYILTHPANAYRITDLTSKVNMVALQAWHVFCSTNQFTFNSVVSTQTSVLEILKDICAAGRASPAMVDGKWTVVIDTDKPDIVQHFTPHNSWGFEASKRLPKQPHALRISYLDEKSDYQESETYIYNEGYGEVASATVAAAEVFEQITLPGVTNPDTIKKHGQWHLAQAALRPEIYTLNTDLEYLVCNRGDRVKVMHDVPLWGLASGRIRNRITTSVPTSITGSGTVATATVISQGYTLHPVGTQIVVSGSSIAAYNGTQTVTASTATTVSWASATTTLATITNTRAATTIAVTVSSTTATATFATQGYVPYAVGSYITITGVQPISYRGRRQVIACTATSVSWIDTVTTTTATVQGTVTGTIVPSITSTACSVFELDEDIPLEASATDSYTIRVRSKTGATNTWNINKVATSGYYNRIQISAYTTAPASAPTTATAAQIDNNDLFMIGTLNQEAQDLLVLAIEPFGNQNAKITLVDYAAELFNPTYGDKFTVPAYSSKITLPPKNLVQSITYKPIITSIISDETVMEQVASGNFKINVKIGFANPAGLPTNVEHVVAEIDDVGDNLDNWITTTPVPIGNQSITIIGVDESKTYRVRLRYISNDGRTGPWQTAVTSAVTSVTSSSNTLTINTLTRHSFSAGTEVYLYNAQGNNFNNIYTIDSIPSRTSLVTRAIIKPTTSITSAVDSTVASTRVGYATAAYAGTMFYKVGSKINVVGATPASYNGTAFVTSCDGTSVSWATGNQLVCTENFSLSPWTPGSTAANTTVTYEAGVTNSLGVAGVSKLQALVTTVTAVSRWTTQATGAGVIPNNAVINFSVEAKAAEFSTITLQVLSKRSGNIPNIRFNLSTGTIIASTNTSNTVAPILNSGIDNLGNGWYRCWMAFNVGVGTQAPTVYIALPTAVATAGQGIYVTRAQLGLGLYPTQYVPVLTSTPTTLPVTATVQGTISPCVTTTLIVQSAGVATATFAAQDYLSFATGSSVTISGAAPTRFNGTFEITGSTPTTITWDPNRITFPSEFNNAAWTKTDTTITADDTTAPDGTPTADLVTEGTAGTAFTTIGASSVAAGSTVYASIYVKRSAIVQWVRVRLSSNASNGGNVWFNLQTGVLGNQTNFGTGTATTGTITALDNNWYKLTATTTIDVADTTASFGFNSASANGSVTRVSSSTYWAWGAHISETALTATTQGTIVRTHPTGTWVTSAVKQLNQDLITGQGITSSKNNLNNTFLAENLQHKVIGKTSPPATVTNFIVSPNYGLGRLNLSWDANGEIDVQYYEVRTDDINWGSTTGQVYLGSSTTVDIAPGAVGTSVTYYIKAIDYSKNYSVTAATALNITTAPNRVTTYIGTVYNSTSLTDTNVTFTWAAAPITAYVSPNSTFATAKYRVTLTKPPGTPGDDILVQDVVGTSWTTPANWAGNAATPATISIVTIDVLGNLSIPSNTFTINKALPPNVGTISAPVEVGTGLFYTWTELSATSTGLPILGYEIRASDSNWGNNAQPPIYSGSSNSATIDLKSSPSAANTPGTVKLYYIKAYDVDGQYSATATSFSYTIAAPVDTTWSAVPFTFGDTSLTSATLTLNWNAATPRFGLYGYELSYTTTGGVAVTRILNTTSITLNTGAVWTTTGTGSVTFTIKVIDNIGIANKSTGVPITATKLAPAAVSNFSSKVIDNNVLLSWNAPIKTTLPIDHISIYKGDTYATAVNIGDKTGTFTTVFEQTGGSFTYWAVTVDTDNVVSTPVSLTALVASPPDYIFNAAYSSIFADINTRVTNTVVNSANITVADTKGIYAGMQIILSGTAFGGLTAGYWYVVFVVDGTTLNISNSSSLTPVFTGTSTASGTMTLIDATGAVGINTNSFYDTQGILMPVNTTETFTTHFASGTGRTWTGPSDQNNYFPIFIQPGTSTGFYEEVFNYTKPLASSQITMSYTGTAFGAPAIATTISTAPTVAGGVTVSNTANSTTLTSSATGGGLVVGNFITVPSNTGQTVRITAIASTTVTVSPAIVAANSAGTSFSYAGTWTDYTGTVALGTAFQYVKARITAAQATRNAGPGTISAPGGTNTTVTVTGTSTLFTKVFKTGDVITIPNTAVGVDYAVASVTSDTVLTVTVPAGVTMSAQSAVTYAYKGTDLYKLQSLGVKLDAKQRTDSGMVVVNSADAGGSIVNFSNTFVDIASITLAPQGTTPISCIYSFSDTNITGTYNIPGTTVCTITTSAAHGFINGQSINVTFTSGAGVSRTYVIGNVTSTTFTVTVPAAITTSGSVSLYPNSMTVYAYNDAGTRVSVPSPGVSWTVRGF